MISRFLVWGHETGIVRALLDGTEVRRLVAFPWTLIGPVEVDPKTALVYWVNRGSLEVFECDLEGNYQRKWDLSAERTQRIEGGFAVLDNIMFWHEWSAAGVPDNYHEIPTLYRADVRTPATRLAYNSDGDVKDIEILSGRATFDDSIEDPCANAPCSHICVQTNNQKKHTCLCPDDYALNKNGRDCTLGTSFISPSEPVGHSIL